MNNNETPNNEHLAGGFDHPVRREIDLENSIIHAAVQSDRGAEKLAAAIRWAMTRLSKGDKDYLAELSGVKPQKATTCVASNDQLGAAQPAAYECRFFYGEDTVTPGWGSWERVDPRNPYTDTVENRVREIQYYISLGKRYELRALYVGPMPVVSGA